MSIGKNIFNARKQKGMTQEQLGDAIGVKKQTIQKYEKEVVINIPVERLKAIANVLGVSPVDLMSVDNNIDLSASIKMNGRIPIYGTIAAGEPIFAEQNIIDSVLTDEIHPENFFGLKVKGDSMINAGIPSGSYVVFLKQETAENGQIVACRVNGDEATLKRFRQQGDTVLLSPENPKYEPIIISAADFESGYAQILGVAKQVITKIT